MADLLYHTFAFLALFSYGIYHLVSATRAHLFRPSSAAGPSSSTSSPAARGLPPVEYVARPYYSLPLPPHRHHLLRHLPLCLALLALFLAAAHDAFFPDAPGSPLHRFASLESALAILLFLLLAASFLLSSPPLPIDIVFLLAALGFGLLSFASAHSAAAYQPSDLQSKCDSIASRIFAASSAASLALAILPRLFVAELALSAAFALQGLWSLQTGLSLYVESCVPEGCHHLLDLPVGDAAATRCDLEDSRVRAAALLDLAFVLHAAFVSIVSVAVYAAVAKASGVPASSRPHVRGSYEALPTSSSTGAPPDMDQVQMKAITKTSSMQA